MPKYGISFSAFATTTGLKTASGIFPDAAGENVEIVECTMTGGGTVAAADIQHQASVAKGTWAATGVSTSTTPQPFHSGASAAKASCGTAYTTEPTAYTAIPPIMFGFNQRGGMRWAVPQGEGVKVNNANTEKGCGMKVISSAVGTVDGYMHFWEDN